jgi:hypothetical protein
MSVIKLVQGDNRPYIKVTLTNADGTAVDVSSASTVVQLFFRAAGTSSILSTITCTKPNGGSDGVVQFNFPSATLNVTPGSYEGEIQITFGTEVQTVYDTLKFYVRQQF